MSGISARPRRRATSARLRKKRPRRDGGGGVSRGWGSACHPAAGCSISGGHIGGISCFAGAAKFAGGQPGVLVEPADEGLTGTEAQAGGKIGTGTVPFQPH